MLKSNLAVLMAERGLKIVDVYKQTGISKTTLMALSDNKSKGVQFETIDKLCNFFEVTPKEFFVFSEYMFEFSNVMRITDVSKNKTENDLAVTVNKGSSGFICAYKKIIIQNIFQATDLLEKGINEYDFQIIIEPVKSRNIADVYKKLQPILKRDIENEFLKFAKKSFNDYVIDENIESGSYKVAVIIKYGPSDESVKVIDFNI